jgi:hypothetical protein
LSEGEIYDHITLGKWKYYTYHHIKGVSALANTVPKHVHRVHDKRIILSNIRVVVSAELNVTLCRVYFTRLESLNIQLAPCAYNIVRDIRNRETMKHMS